MSIPSHAPPPPTGAAAPPPETPRSKSPGLSKKKAPPLEGSDPGDAIEAPETIEFVDGSDDDAADPVLASDGDPLPDKEYFKIGEVARLVGVKPYVLRFWESEFRRDIHPERTRSNQRMYRKRDVLTFLRIKRLRYEEKLELSGARQKLREPQGARKAQKKIAGAGRSVGVAIAGKGRSSTRMAAGEAGRDDRPVIEALEELIRIVDSDEAGE